MVNHFYHEGYDGHVTDWSVSGENPDFILRAQRDQSSILRKKGPPRVRALRRPPMGVQRKVPRRRRDPAHHSSYECSTTTWTQSQSRGIRSDTAHGDTVVSGDAPTWMTQSTCRTHGGSSGIYNRPSATSPFTIASSLRAASTRARQKMHRGGWRSEKAIISSRHEKAIFLKVAPPPPPSSSSSSPPAHHFGCLAVKSPRPGGRRCPGNGSLAPHLSAEFGRFQRRSSPRNGPCAARVCASNLLRVRLADDGGGAFPSLLEDFPLLQSHWASVHACRRASRMLS